MRGPTEPPLSAGPVPRSECSCFNRFPGGQWEKNRGKIRRPCQVGKGMKGADSADVPREQRMGGFGAAFFRYRLAGLLVAGLLVMA